MNKSCVAVEDLARLLALPEGHAERAHLDRCTRCRSLADMLREFESPSEQPAAAGFADADAKLQETIAGLTGIAPAMSASAPRQVRGGSGTSFLQWLSAWRVPRLQLAGAFAALLLVCVAGVAVWQSRMSQPTMRSAGAEAEFVAASARDAIGSIELTWNSVRGADAYVVVFLDDSLREIARLDATSETRALLTASALPQGLEHGMAVAWQVEAIAGGDRIRVTPPGTLRVP